MSGFDIFRKGIGAGMMICIGCIVYSSVGGLAGAVLFSLGLLVILRKEYLLYTGKCGYLLHTVGVADLAKIWVANLVGVGIVAMVVAVFGGFSTDSIASAKAGLDCVSVMGRAFGCGMLMYTAASSGKDIITVLCVVVFIMAGFEHSIADMGYFLCGSMTEWTQGARVVALATVGNLMGAVVMHAVDEAT